MTCDVQPRVKELCCFFGIYISIYKPKDIVLNIIYESMHLRVPGNAYTFLTIKYIKIIILFLNMPMNIPGRYTKYKTPPPPNMYIKGEYDRVVSATGLKE